jgi:hypothetical protein
MAGHSAQHGVAAAQEAVVCRWQLGDNLQVCAMLDGGEK